MLKGGVLVILRRLLVMNKTILKFVFAESFIILGFQLFTLNILWSLVADGEGIFGAALILATSFAFRAVFMLYLWHRVN